MISSLKGRLLYKKPDNVVVEVHGVGYQVHIPVSLLAALPSEGAEVFLHIYTHVREDALQLYGFPSEEEKKVFTTLIGVTGVGPRMALNILSGISVNDFLKAINTEDVEKLCRIPGLGKKTAHRLILELREKLPAAEGGRGRMFDDALSALTNLGYKRAEAQESLEVTIKKGYTQIEDLLKEALKYLTGGQKS